jgi:hypothetical protein
VSVLIVPFVPLEGCTLTANEAHGIRYCPIEIVKADLVDRNLSHMGLTHEAMRLKLELILREEEELEALSLEHVSTG